MEAKLNNAEAVLEKLKSMADREKIETYERYGIDARNPLGISIPDLRKLASAVIKEARDKRHDIAARIYDCKIHEAMLLACLIDDKKLVTQEQMDSWAVQFYSWDLCDAHCFNLFDRTPFAWDKAIEWSERHEEFVKRAGFVLMAGLAVHDKEAHNLQFEPFFPVLVKHATDDRNFVKKAVNWALRGLGKRNMHLNAVAIKTSGAILEQHGSSTTARWIARNALRELTSDKVYRRFK